jgi:hypothetical protein
MTTTSIINALTTLTCDAYTVTAVERPASATAPAGRIVASYRTTAADLAQAETDGADASARIAEVLEAAGYTFSDAGGDDPGIYEVWHAPATRPVTVAIDTACKHAGAALIWGVAEGDDADVAIADAAQWLAEGDEVRASHRREAAALDVVTIQWPAGEAIPDGQNARAIALAQAALAV